MENIPKYEAKVFSKEGELVQEFKGTYSKFLDFIYDYRIQKIKCEIEYLDFFDHIVRLK